MSDFQGLAVGERAPDVTAPLVRPDGETTETSLAELWATMCTSSG